MAYTIVSDVCEGCQDCIPICPVDCISHRTTGPINPKGATYSVIDGFACIDRGACLRVCPIEGAILDEWRPELQKV